MRPILPVLKKDFYKVGHVFQYPPDTRLVYSNITGRGSRIPAIDKLVVFGLQAFVKEYLIEDFNRNFFAQPLDAVLKAYKRRITNALGPLKSYDHIANLHTLGYLPLMVKALPEGTRCPMRVPFTTLFNTHKEFYWLTNMIETVMSNYTWQPITAATIAFQYRTVFERFARETGAPLDFVKWQGHDFSYRGMEVEPAPYYSGGGHLLSFTGTDTIPAIDFLEQLYGADSDKELVGGSVPATEHSVMCAGGEADEYETYHRLITEVYPDGIVSIVSDTWDFWHVITDTLPRLREVILARQGKVVVRPDSGDPVRIICGDPDAPEDSPASYGAIRLLYSVFGGRTNEAGYIELDPHIGLIYGDSITPDRQTEILSRLKALGYASSNVVLGIGSYTYQCNTRDTFGQAIKATYIETESGGAKPIFKKPKTDDGLKNSARGLLQVRQAGDNIILVENVDWAHEAGGLLQPIFHNGQLRNETTLSEIRARIDAHFT